MITETKTAISNGIGSFSLKEPTDEEFECFRELVLKKLGLSWTGDKKYLLYARLQRRLQYLNIRTFGDWMKGMFYIGML